MPKSSGGEKPDNHPTKQMLLCLLGCFFVIACDANSQKNSLCSAHLKYAVTSKFLKTSLNTRRCVVAKGQLQNLNLWV